MDKRICKNCMYKMSYEQMKTNISREFVEEHGMKRGQYVCPLNNFELIKDMKNTCEQHVFKVN